jgi:hypothetical protein
MFSSIFGKKSPQKKGGPVAWEPSRAPNNSQSRNPTYSKVFRWRLPDGHTEQPKTVEVLGSFNNWQRVQMMQDSVLDAWHVTVHNIPGHQTHHYMLLVDGKPTADKNCDGFAPPRGFEEERYTLQTDRGPRVFMLFAQTK